MTSVQACKNITGTFGGPQPPDTTSRAPGLKGISLLDRIETIRSDAKIDGADPTISALTGKIDVRFADTTLLDQAINGTAAALEFSYALGSGESLTLTAHAVYLPRPRIEIKGPKGVQASFDWQAALATSPARMCTVVLVNTMTGYS